MKMKKKQKRSKLKKSNNKEKRPFIPPTPLDGKSDEEFKREITEYDENGHPIKKKRVKQNYFDNPLVESMILAYKRGGHKNTRLYDDIMVHLDKIVVAIINKYHFYRYYNYDDLVQEGRMACMDGIKRFDMKKVLQPGKSVFSFFSNVVKRNLRFFTLNKNRKIIKEVKYEADDWNKIEKYGSKYDNTDVLDGIVELGEFFSKLQNFFNDKKRMKNLVYVLEKYTKEVGGPNFKQKDFVAYSKSFGVTSEYCKKFLNIVRDNKDNLVRM